MAKKKSSPSKKKSSTKRSSGAGCSCGTINRKTGPSSAKWTQCRKKGKFVRMQRPGGKGIECSQYTYEGKVVRRCYKRAKNELTQRMNWVPTPMLKKCGN
ncbi:MAG: hypothetical protein IPK85_01265 [Gemmatimonadetes bacterium]|nr:hypothetical protein [Gemmatimonadota bacterium]